MPKRAHARAGLLGEGGFEAVLGDDWHEQIENAEVTFADDNHATVPPLTPDEEGPTELVREVGEWRIVVEEEAATAETTTEDTDEQYAEFTEEARDLQADIIERVREIDVIWNRATLRQFLGDSIDSWDVLSDALESDNAITADELSQAALADSEASPRCSGVRCRRSALPRRAISTLR